MLSVSTRVGPTVIEIVQTAGRKKSTFVVYANGWPVDEGRTVAQAKRKANGFAGSVAFDLTEDGCAAH